MAKRLATAEREANANGASDELKYFRRAVRKSHAVRARSLDEVYRLVKGDDQLTATFHDLKGAGMLRPRDNEIEKARQSSEPLVFPNYNEKIVFAVLTLDDGGLFAYGNCCMVFQENKIANRATVFEENCVLFCRKKQNTEKEKTRNTGEPVPEIKQFPVRQPEKHRIPLLKEVGTFLMYEFGLKKRTKPMTRKELILAIAISDSRREIAESSEEGLKWLSRNTELRKQAHPLSVKEQNFVYAKTEEIVKDYHDNRKGVPVDGFPN